MADVIGQRIAGNLVYIDRSAHLKRLIDAIGPDVVKYVDDFERVSVASSVIPGWVTTLVNASTVTIADASGGAIILTTDGAENDGVSTQLDGESFGFSSSQRATYFGIKLQASEATESDFLVGLCITDTALLGGMTDGVYFRKADGSTSVAFVTEKDSTETSTTGVLTFAADTNYLLEFYFDGTAIEAFVDGVSVARHTTNIPDNELLTPSIEFLTGATAAETMQIDWVRAIQIGR